MQIIKQLISEIYKSLCRIQLKYIFDNMYLTFLDFEMDIYVHVQ